MLAAIGIEYIGFHRFAVFQTKLKYMADLDAACDRNRALAIRARVALDDVTDVDKRGFRQVATPVDTGEMGILLVGAANEVRQIL